MERRKMAEKATTPRKKTVKRKVNKGDSLVCEVCGLSVVVEDFGDIGEII
jgi:rubrerythrin